MPDEPTAVVITGSAASGRGAVLGALLGRAAPAAEAPPGGYVVVSYHPAGATRAAAVAWPGRPPRRVDVTLADPVLRHVTLVGTPATDRLDVAGVRVLADVAGRGGAAVCVVRCGDRLIAGEIDVLIALVQAGVAVFFAITPDAAGRWRGPALRGRRLALPDRDVAEAAVDAYRSLVGAKVPELVDAPWYPVDPPAVDAAHLRQALVDWASAEALRRAADSAPVGAGRVRMPDGGSRWRAHFERVHRSAGYAVRHHIGLELVRVHLRCVRHLRRTADPDDLLWLLDDELHALSVHADVVGDQALTGLLQEVLQSVFVDGVPPGVTAGLRAAVQDRILTDQSAGALLVSRRGEVVAVPGRAAAAALRALPAPEESALPATSVALAGDCWGPCRPRPLGGVMADVQDTAGELERALSAAVERRFDALGRALSGVVGKAVRDGILPY